ncbi:hypothetical protein [Lentzea sp. CA-135723]|uniref:hypothetical protein n=1 Tax=Lentzea sp. CA-135723 TaxID=3239950 RepID=UPI003D8FCFE7
MTALREEITGWVSTRRQNTAMKRLAFHFSALEITLGTMIDRVEAELSAAGTLDTGLGYERCRTLDTSTAHIRRCFYWYQGKYEQRDDDRFATVLRSADEIVRSCWAPAFAARETRPPTAPLCFVDSSAEVFTIRRCVVPGGLTAKTDKLLASLITELPVPVIAVPETATREAWWLVLVAHETAHQLHDDLQLVDVSARALALAAGPEHEHRWQVWNREVFADTYAVVMTGEAAIWAVEELQHCSPARMTEPNGGYPPPVVRAELMREVLRQLNGEPTPASSGPVTHEEFVRLPSIAESLLRLPIAASATLRELRYQDAWVSVGAGQGWAEQLLLRAPLITPVDTQWAARKLITAGVQQYNAHPGGRTELRLLHDNLLSTLSNSGEPGFLAAPRPNELRALGNRLSDQLLEGDA